MIRPLLRALLTYVVTAFAVRPKPPEATPPLALTKQACFVMKQSRFWISVALHCVGLFLALLPQVGFNRRTALSLAALFVVRMVTLVAQTCSRRTALLAAWEGLQLVAVVLFLHYVTGLPPPWTAIKAALLEPALWLILLTYALAVWPAGTLVGALAKRWFDQIKHDEATQGLQDGGLWIGRLERCLTISFVLADHVDAIAALVVAKGVIRFAEIKDAKHRRAAEYIFIGSMASFGIALLLGWTARWMIQHPTLLRW